MSLKDKRKLIRIIIAVIAIIIIAGATYAIIPFIKLLITEEGRLKISEKVGSFGVLSVVIFILFQIIQIVIAIIPGEPVEIIGGILFGALGGAAACLAGILAGTITVYYLVKWIGKPLVNAVFDSRKLEKYKILNDNRRLEVFIFTLFLIPGTPKDILTFLVPMTKIKPHTFFMLSTIARIPTVLSSTFVGANLGKGDWRLGIIIFAITAAIGFVGILYNEKILGKVKEIKSKHTKHK